MRILVTGGAGFIGSHLLAALAKDDNLDLVVLDNLLRGRSEALGSGGKIGFIQGDVRDRQCMNQAMRGVDVVIHLAAQSNVVGAVKDIDYSFTTNVLGTFEVLKAAKENGVRRVVFTSSREVYGDAATLPVPEDALLAAKNAYGASKIAGEVYCRVFSDSTMDVNVLRLANVYGPGDRDRVIPIFLENARRGDALVLYGGQQVLDFIWVDYVVEAIRLAAFGSRFPGPINLGSGIGTAIGTLADRVLKSVNSSSRIQMEPSRQIETVKFVADVTRARDFLGFCPPEDPLFGLPILANYQGAA